MKTCKKCLVARDLSEFYVRQSGKKKGQMRMPCKFCESAKALEWWSKHPDRAKRNHDNWVEKNPQRAKELARNNYMKHAKEINERARKKHANSPLLRQRRTEYVRDWTEKNPVRAKQMRKSNARTRNERLKNSSGFCMPHQLYWKMEMWGWKCAYCKGPFEELEHAIPVSRGGCEWPANMRPSCRECNLQKSAKTPKEYAEYLAALVT